MASLRRFSHDDIEKLRLMADCGHTGKAIAKALGRTPQAVRVKCCELGIKLKPQSVANRRVRLPVPVWVKLKAGAEHLDEPATITIGAVRSWLESHRRSTSSRQGSRASRHWCECRMGPKLFARVFTMAGTPRI